MKWNLERFGRVCTLDLQFFADFIERILSMDTVLCDTWWQFKNITINVVRHRRRDVRSMIDSSGDRLHLRVSILPYFHPFCPSPTLTCDANASTKDSQPFGDATCDESMRKRVFRFGTSEEAEGRKKKKKMKMRGKYRARGDSCADTWWEFALISTRLVRSTRRRRCFLPRRWYFADTQREQRSSFAVDEKQYCADDAIPHGKYFFQRRRFRFTAVACGRLLKSSITNGYHNELLHKDIWHKYLSHIIYSFSYSDMTLRYERNSFSNGKLFRNTSSRERQCQKWGSYRDLNSRKQLLCQWKRGLAKFTFLSGRHRNRNLSFYRILKWLDNRHDVSISSYQVARLFRVHFQKHYKSPLLSI